MSTIRHEEVGVIRQPSPSVWNRFRLTRMQELGLGYFFHEEFFGASPNILVAAETTPQFGPFGVDADTDTVVTALSNFGGHVDIETDGDDNDAYAVFTKPWNKTVLNSSQPWAFETNVHLGDVAMDGGMFFGLVENAGLSRDVVADDAGGLITESLIGFQILTDNPDAIDAVYRLDAGTTVEMIADISNSAAITRAGGTAAVIANDTAFKLGMVFDGRDQLQIFFNGYKVWTETIDGTVFPVNVEMGLVGFALKTGAAAAESAACDWARGAYGERA